MTYRWSGRKTKGGVIRTIGNGKQMLKKYIVKITDWEKPNRMYCYPTSKYKALKIAKNLKYEMKIAIPKYKFARNIKVIPVHLK